MGFIWFTLLDHSSSVKEVRAGTEERTTEEYCLLVQSLTYAQTTFLIHSKPTCLGIGDASSGLGPSTSIISQDNLSERQPKANPIKTILQLRSF